MGNKDLKYLKRHYGENFAHLCRTLFPTLLEHEGLLSKIISDHFGASRSLYNDILPIKNEFQEFVYGCAELKGSISSGDVTKTPEELMSDAGYILYPECTTEEDIQSFKKYWAPGEELCTFLGGRLDSCRVWFAIKKNVDEIKRENFIERQRQDEYGTSAISIQFSRGRKSILSIKNRYNHTVAAPDATFGNNLDNIIPGLTQAFLDTYGLELLETGERSFYIHGYQMGSDGRFYKVNEEIYGVQYCENNVILHDGKVDKLDKARYILVDNYVVDKQAKKIMLYPNESDSFTESIGEIKDITTKTDEKGNTVIVCTPVTGEDVEITINAQNSLIGYKNPNVTEIGDGFLEFNRVIENVDLPKLTKVGNGFLAGGLRELKKISFPNLVSVGDSFISADKYIEEVNLPKLERVGNEFLGLSKNLKKLSLPNLVSAKVNFLWDNNMLTELYCPKLKRVGDHFLVANTSLTSLALPSLRYAGSCFMRGNCYFDHLDLPKLKSAEEYFLASNVKIKDFNAPELRQMGRYSLIENVEIQNFNAPKLEICPDKILRRMGREPEREMEF